jgi:hypothetical protein
MADQWLDFDFTIPLPSAGHAERVVDLHQKYEDAAENLADPRWGTEGLRKLGKEGFGTEFKVEIARSAVRVTSQNHNGGDTELLEEFVRSVLAEFDLKQGVDIPVISTQGSLKGSVVLHVRRPGAGPAFGPEAMRKLEQAGVTDLDELLAIARDLAGDIAFHEAQRREGILRGHITDEPSAKSYILQAEQIPDDAYDRADRLEALSARMRKALGRPADYDHPIPSADDDAAPTPKF